MVILVAGETMNLAQVLPAEHLVLDEVRGQLAADGIPELVGTDPGSRTLRIQVRLGEDVAGRQRGPRDQAAPELAGA